VSALLGADPAVPAATVEAPAVAKVWTRGFSAKVLALAVFVGAVGLYGSPYILAVGSKVAIYAIVVIGLTLLVGYGGQISFGHNAFFGVGGYTSALATTSWGLNPVLGLSLGVAFAALLATIIGFPTLRLRGHFLALGTFAVGLGFYAFAVAAPYFNGFSGIGGIPPFRLGSLVFDTGFLKFWLSGAFLLLAVIAVSQLREGRWGRALRTVATDEATASSVGINPHRMKMGAFIFSAALASVAGTLYAHTVTYVSPETFSFNTILTFFMMLFIGGLGSVWGAILGALIVTAIPEIVPSAVASWQPTIFGVLLVAVLIVRPSGLLGGQPLKVRRLRRAKESEVSA
jgi:branched-chain amino acid transport system permease protein